MDFRVLIAIAFGLVAVALGGFYFAFGSRSHDSLVAQQATSLRGGAGAIVSPAAPGAAQSQQSAPSQSSAAQAPEPPPVRPGKATPESIEAEIAKSDHAEKETEKRLRARDAVGGSEEGGL